jgi:hypothetical protein
VPVISDQEYDHFQRLRKVFSHLNPEMSGYPFLTGVSDKQDDTGFPEYVHICLVHGANLTATYKKV